MLKKVETSLRLRKVEIVEGDLLFVENVEIWSTNKGRLCANLF